MTITKTKVGLDFDEITITKTKIGLDFDEITSLY